MNKLFCSLAAAVGLGAITPSFAVAQNLLPAIPSVEASASPVEVLKTQIDTVRDISSGVLDRINLATLRLEDVADANTTELEATVDAMFSDLRNDVNIILQETSSTSDLRNALSRAREQAIVFQQDLQRRPLDHRNREQRLATLEAVIADYEQLGSQLDERAANAAQALFQLSQQQNQIVEDIRFAQIERARDALLEVVSGLSLLAESIGELEPPSFEDVVVN